MNSISFRAYGPSFVIINLELFCCKLVTVQDCDFLESLAGKLSNYATFLVHPTQISNKTDCLQNCCKNTNYKFILCKICCLNHDLLRFLEKVICHIIGHLETILATKKRVAISSCWCATNLSFYIYLKALVTFNKMCHMKTFWHTVFNGYLVAWPFLLHMLAFKTTK